VEGSPARAASCYCRDMTDLCVCVGRRGCPWDLQGLLLHDSSARLLNVSVLVLPSWQTDGHCCTTDVFMVPVLDAS